MDLQKFCDKKAMSGYGSALLYKDAQAGDTKYHLLLPLETVPAVNGSVDTFEFDLLTCPSKGQVEGKESLDQKDVEFLWHRDNVKRLESLQGRVIDFLAVYGDMTGRKFSGTIKVRPNDVSNDVARGTFTITPISASTTTIEDVSDIIQDTVAFASTIPAEIEVVVGTAYKLDCATNPATGTTVEVNSSSTSITGSYASNAVTINATQAGTAVITLKAKDSAASNPTMASWETTVRVVAKTATPA